MEFEDVSPEVEWEARRVAAAFGLGEWEIIAFVSASGRQFWKYRGHDVEWDIEIIDVKVFALEIGDEESYCDLYRYPDYWVLDAPDGKHDERMARGLYCLGFEDEALLAELPALSAHEKLELRLSMPREFWPQRWLRDS